MDTSIYSHPIFQTQELLAFCDKVPTPFYIYDEESIRRRCRQLFQAFSWNPGFQQFFAVKATPNPHIVKVLDEEGCGTDCSSVAELVLSERLGMNGSSIMFTSNNTTRSEFQKAIDLGAIINLDTPSLLPTLLEIQSLPTALSFRFNPGAEGVGNILIGKPEESKFGCTREQILSGFRDTKRLGIKSHGLHAMVVSNELDVKALLENCRMLFSLAVEVKQKIGISVDFINLGGGIGIPYKDRQEDVDLDALGAGVKRLFESILIPNGLGDVAVMTENGRALTGPFGFLVTKVINLKQSYKNYVGVDACMSNLMRPGMYGAYHRISLVSDENRSISTVDVVGSLCENNDKFAIDRQLPTAKIGDLLIIHDAGAHGHCMGFQYNGRLRSAEYLAESNGGVRLIRRAETLDDYFSTVDFPDSPSGPKRRTLEASFQAQL